MTLADGLRKRNKASKREVPPHLTYMIAEQLVDKLDVTKFRDYGLGERDAGTLPGRHHNSESEWENASRSRYWQARRKWVQSANSAGVKY